MFETVNKSLESVSEKPLGLCEISASAAKYGVR